MLLFLMFGCAARVHTFDLIGSKRDLREGIQEDDIS